MPIFASLKQTQKLKTMNYKAHLFASLGNGKLHPQRMQCGRHLFRNERGTHVVKSTEFKRLFLEDEAAVCEKCLEWAKKNKKLTN